MKIIQSLAVFATFLSCAPAPLLYGQTASAPAAAAAKINVTVVSDIPTHADTDLLIFCLFRSSPRNQLSGSLTALNQSLNGALAKVRSETLFDGQLGETMLITPPAGSMKPTRVLAIGMGDSQTFTPDRMYEVGKIAYLEAQRLGATHPWFAAAVLDGGVKKYSTGDVASVVVRGFRDAAQLEQELEAAGLSAPGSTPQFSYLAGGENAASTRAGIAQTLGK